jgi:hypothetical protein
MLLEAEMMTIRAANSSMVLQKYILAISVAKQVGNLLLTALSNELTAKYLLSAGFSKGDASRYMEDATITYNQWGAHAKAIHLKREFAILAGMDQ